MHYLKRVQTLALIVSLSWFAGCNTVVDSSDGFSTGQQSASVFTVATDAPLPSVISFQLTVDSITLFNGTTNVSVLSQPATVDFARLNVLHELVDLNTVPVGTYTSATLTLASPVIGFLDILVDPPEVETINGTLLQTSVTVPFANPFVLGADDLVGLRMEFDIRSSLETDDNGDITGDVDPTFHMRLLAAGHADLSIDNFRGGVVSVTDNTTFVMQGPRGRQWTVITDGETDLVTDEGVGALLPNTIVGVSGNLNRVTRAIHATELAVLSFDHFVVGGLLTSVRPSPGPAEEIDLFIRRELPELGAMPVGGIGTLMLNGSETYRIANRRRQNIPSVLNRLFDNSSLVAGQELAVGGVIHTENGVDSLIPRRVILMPQGVTGTLAGDASVIAGNVGSFPLDIRTRSIASLLLPNPLTVRTTHETRFIDLGGLSELMGDEPIRLRVVGFVLLNASGQPVLVARAVAKLPST